MTPRPRVVLIEGSLGGARGNTRVVADRAREALLPSVAVDRIVLARKPGFAAHRQVLEAASGFVFLTGTYWDSWSSHLQHFLEEATPTETTGLWLGKPAAVLVTEHSVGGKGVVSRLQGVLCTLGCLLPPTSGVVISKIVTLHSKRAAKGHEDFFGLSDVDVACRNVLAAIHGTPYRAWEVDRGNPKAKWLRP